MALHGVDTVNEQKSDLFNRDISTSGESISKFIGSKEVGIVAIGFAGACFFVPGGADVFLFVGGITMYLHSTKKMTLPFRLPAFAKRLDFNDRQPGTGKPQLAKGISFWANAKKTNQQLWFNNDDLRRHAIIFGTTGSGKSEALISIAFNSLIQGSGLLYCDGKGDNGVFWSIYSMVRRMFREDDLLVVNYMTGGSDVRASDKMLSNTMNPFFSGSSSAVSELLAGLMGSGGGGDDMWKNRALTFVSSLVKVLCYMRDQGEIVLSIAVIRDYMTLDMLLELIKRNDIPEDYLAGLSHYMRTLPGMDKRQLQSGKFSDTVNDQHGYITMQLTHSMNMLSDEYGHIFKVGLGDVDFLDVVVNRRILVVLLPALEKSPASLSNLGKVIVASLKQMMSYGLGSELEGERSIVVDAKPTTGPSPFTIILDEYGYYAVDGAAVMPAQARSLGFSMIFAGQDYQAFKKGDEEGAASIVANCAIKICMKLEDPTDTYDIFFKRAGESEVASTQGFNRQNSGMSNRYLDSGNVSIERRGRINIRDLAGQTEGEAHIIFGDTVCRADMFYAAPQKVKNARLNDFLAIHPPTDSEVSALTEGFSAAYEKFITRIDSTDVVEFDVPEIADITVLNRSLADAERLKMGEIESCISAFLDVVNSADKSTDELFAQVGESKLSSKASIDTEDPFTSIQPPPGHDPLIDLMDDYDDDVPGMGDLGSMPPPPFPVDLPEINDGEMTHPITDRAMDMTTELPNAAALLDDLLDEDGEESEGMPPPPGQPESLSPAEILNAARTRQEAIKEAERMKSGSSYPKKPKPEKRSVKAILSLLEEIASSEDS